MSGNTKDFKVKAGIQPTSYFEGVGTVVSGSEGYSLSSASYDNKSGSTVIPGTYAFVFNNDGTKLFKTRGNFNDDEVVEYPLSTAYDISTIGSSSAFINVNAQMPEPTGLAFNTSGTKLFVLGGDVFEYNLTTSFDLTTATYSGNSFSTGFGVFGTNEIKFSPDGLSMYLGNADEIIRQFTLTTAFDITTASSANKSLDVSVQEPHLQSFTFNSDGTKVFVSGTNSSATWGVVYQYNLSTAFDISTGVYSGISFDTSVEGPEGQCIEFSADGTKLYSLKGSTGVIYQYSTVLNTATLDLSTGSVFEITPTSDIQVTLSNPADSGTVSGATLLLDGGASAGYDLDNGSYSNKSFSVSSQGSNPRGLVFNSDGTKMYIVGPNSDSVFQYSLSAGFDVNTASYDSVSFSVESQETFPHDITFNNDGTKMYMVGASSDSVHQYSLSTAYNLSTASYDSVSFDVSSQAYSPQSIAFNSDGTKMYILGDGTDSVYQYSLSTAFDLSTASYDSVSFSVESQETFPYGIAFNSDGTKMYMIGPSSDSVHQYSLSTGFDLSTASYDSVSFSVSGQEGNPADVAFNDDGTNMYIVGSSSGSVHQYSTATPATITYDTAIEWPSGTAPTSPAVGETDIITFNTRDGGSTYAGVLAIDGAS